MFIYSNIWYITPYYILLYLKNIIVITCYQLCPTLAAAPVVFSKKNGCGCCPGIPGILSPLFFFLQSASFSLVFPLFWGLEALWLQSCAFFLKILLLVWVLVYLLYFFCGFWRSIILVFPMCLIFIGFSFILGTWGAVVAVLCLFFFLKICFLCGFWCTWRTSSVGPGVLGERSIILYTNVLHESFNFLKIFHYLVF